MSWLMDDKCMWDVYRMTLYCVFGTEVPGGHNPIERTCSGRSLTMGLPVSPHVKSGLTFCYLPGRVDVRNPTESLGVPGLKSRTHIKH